MVFSSLIFLWLFMPIMIIGYYAVDSRFKNIFLLLGSLFFYAWGEPVYILLMLFSILFNWKIGILIERYENKKKTWLVIGITFNLFILIYHKYFDFIIETINTCFKLSVKELGISLPIGVSFFTFQAISYIIDLYRNEYKAQKNLIDMALYISFFPQLIAGPIIKYKDINNQLSFRLHDKEKFANGIRRFCYGLGKKVIISNTLAVCESRIRDIDQSQLTVALAWGVAIVYTLQIYYDFSGYSDMAIGLGKMFGFDFQENFKYPYMSCSIQEFWQRWHISLGTWFKEYVYIPLGGNKKGKLQTYFNLMVVFFLTGLWHGASWHFVVWGLYHGFFQILERIGLRNILIRHKVIARIYTLVVVIFGWVVFKAYDSSQVQIYLGRMLVPWKYVHVETNAYIEGIFNRRTVFIFIIAILGCGIVQKIMLKLEKYLRLKGTIGELIYCIAIVCVSISMLAGNTYNPFIYFRF